MDLPDDAVDPTALLLLLDAGETAQDALDRLVQACRVAVPGCTDASVTLVREDGPRTAASSSERGTEIDQWEYQRDLGPCIDALKDAQEHYVSSPADTQRYPGFEDVLTARGIGSVLGIPLVAGGAVVGALNVYADVPHAFDGEDSRALARSVAAQVATTVHNVRIFDATRTLAEQLETAMASRATIEQAKGVLAAQTGGTPEEAFAMLRAASQRENVKLRDVAERIVGSVARGDRTGRG
jgi:GAF domain-containing protein